MHSLHLLLIIRVFAINIVKINGYLVKGPTENWNKMKAKCKKETNRVHYT